MGTAIYRNLNRHGYWSIKQDGQVVGHAKHVELVDVTAHHSEKSRQRVNAKGVREVTTWAKGALRAVAWAGHKQPPEGLGSRFQAVRVGVKCPV